MNDTREGEGVTRELATGSITSSRVMELMSNQASEMFQATALLQFVVTKAALAAVVKVTVQRVQSTVQVSLLDEEVAPSTAALLYSVHSIYAAAVATLLVFTQQESLYLVLGFTGVQV